ncbi:MAG: phosphoribosyltransferase family protein [Helicobacter sp.]|nr:phosphoribosyltransferase family protein [Helicobacter sp.]
MYYDYPSFLADIKDLKKQIEASIKVPDALISITRGGMTMTHFLSLAWNIRAVYGINAISYSDKNVQSNLIIDNVPNIKPHEKHILIVDEIVDSGKSLQAVLDKMKGTFPEHTFYTCVIFQKQSAPIKANFYLKEPSEWIDFFWEVDVINDCKC